jgi:hypothetical protein
MRIWVCPELAWTLCRENKLQQERTTECKRKTGRQKKEKNNIGR